MHRDNDVCVERRLLSPVLPPISLCWLVLLRAQLRWMLTVSVAMSRKVFANELRMSARTELNCIVIQIQIQIDLVRVRAGTRTWYPRIHINSSTKPDLNHDYQ